MARLVGLDRTPAPAWAATVLSVHPAPSTTWSVAEPAFVFVEIDGSLHELLSIFAWYIAAIRLTFALFAGSAEQTLSPRGPQHRGGS